MRPWAAKFGSRFLTTPITQLLGPAHSQAVTTYLKSARVVLDGLNLFVPATVTAQEDAWLVAASTTVPIELTFGSRRLVMR